MLAVLTRMHKRFSSDDKASGECQRPPVRPSNRFVRKGTDRPPLESSTTFTMKKPFGLKRASRIWAQIGDTLGTCSFEEDQVRLLSVLAQNSFSISDDSSDTSDCGGRDNQLMASSEEDESSSDSESEDKIPPKYSPVVNHPSVLKNCASSDEVTTPCDPHASLLNNNTIPPFNNAETFIASKDQNGLSPSDPINDKTAVVEDKMEWVFTLYDFDGKGSLTKEDIGSLARSIYDVLGNAKVPLQSKSGASRAGQPIGAFRVKLTVVAESAELDKSQHQPSTVINDPQKPTNVSINKTGDAQKPTIASMKHLITNATVGDRHESKRRRKMSNTADQRHIQQEKVHRRRAAVRYPPPPLWQYPWQRCACNSQSQEYVNLSELENCCTKHNAAHSGVHHVRHCEQHCNCTDRKQARPAPRCFPCGSLRNCCTNPAPIGPQPAASTRRHPFQRTASTGQGGGGRARSPSSTDQVIGGSPCGPHERKHRERDKQYDRSMRLVRQWLIDAASTIDDDPRMQPLRRSFVQHRHVHEHHHYVHHADV